MTTVPRCRLAPLPTPLLAAPALGAAIGVPKLWLKRDDLIAFGFGGNKVRGLEFMLADVKDPVTSAWIEMEVPTKTKSVFGKFLAKWHSRSVGPGNFVVEGKGHSRVFRVERIAPAGANAAVVTGSRCQH